VINTKIEEYEAPASSLEFEITESSYLDNFDRANALIDKIKDIGSFVALDDFGTGYSSLSYLTQINIDTLKIDKQFIDNIGLSKRSSVITKTIIKMAQHLDLEVCVEGVETKIQSDLLLEFGCHLMQGYFYGRPQPLEQAVKKLEDAQNVNLLV
jgi:EAL domain-containing protein (putative c-di-GMP-specific phosphodiesterase class I)